VYKENKQSATAYRSGRLLKTAVARNSNIRGRQALENICKRCLLREMAEADWKMISRYKEAIKKSDRVSDKEYERRLAICKKCELLNAGTCGACGCYVELRAAGKAGRCPYKKWHI